MIYFTCFFCKKICGKIWTVKKSRVFGQSSRESHYQRGKLEITSGKQYSQYGRNIGCYWCHSLYNLLVPWWVVETVNSFLPCSIVQPSYWRGIAMLKKNWLSPWPV
jgi:hypothetical protein